MSGTLDTRRFTVTADRRKPLNDAEENVETRPGFGRVLRHWRKLAGLSQAQLAAELGYHHSVISRWETGERQPPPNRIRRLDDLLGTSGQLATLYAEAATGADRSGELPGLSPHSPLPGTHTGDADAAWHPAGWPSRLPHHGLNCPLHSTQCCGVPPVDEAKAIHTAFTVAPENVHGDVIHVLAAQLALFARIGEEHGPDEIHTPVETLLHLVVRSLPRATGTHRPALLHLAARYAGLAGQLRTLSGQHGAAMALYGKALNWAMLCDDASLRAVLLCDMSSLSRLEHDGPSAVTYAEALSAGSHRAWTSALSHLYQARGHGIQGDLRETTRHVAAARDHLDHITADDEQQAPWIAGVHGQVHVEAGVGGALRDVAAATADRAVAHAAIAATEHAMASVPAHFRPATVLLALRLADSYACAGQPEAAVAIATPVLAEATTIPMSTISHELRGLRARLAARWPGVTPVKVFLDRG